jgi:phosphonate transport system substrate-binding protein
VNKVLFSGLLLATLLLASCSFAAEPQKVEPFVIGAIPDQDPEELQRRFGLLAGYLEQELGVPVEYKPVTDYAASVTAFRVGDLDLVWFGGLTGVQARLQVDGAQALVQRDTDPEFHSVFIANKGSGLTAFDNVSQLSQLKGRLFTFGSESSTSGRLMPQYYLSQAGVTLDDFKGEVGFSGSHDATIDLVEAGTYEAGALNENVWKSRVEAGDVDLDKVSVIWRTPGYHDYHWVIRPDITERYGEDFIDSVTQAFLKLDPNDAEHKQILDLFSAERFIATQNDNYIEIEAIGREIGRIK